jgi:glutamate synthase domain-containing protein 2
MGRLIIFGFVLLSVFLAIVMIIWLPLTFLTLVCLAIIIIGSYDVLQRKHTILRNFPIFGHLRFIFESIRPEIQQYFISSDQSEHPFSREIRSIVYQRAKKVLDTVPFGTKHNLGEPGYESIRHSLAPTHLKEEEEGRVWIGGPDCKQPYHASRLNISAMSFGALSKNAVLALNKGAKLGNFAHNTGEGGLSDYHLAGGGDLIWQLGTANFGARTLDGQFSPEEFRKKACLPQVKMIEIKLSQGAKPSHGGILPAIKVTPEIAAMRGVHVGVDCISPPTNPEFSTPIGLLEYVAKLRELSGGKPVGFKLCIGFHRDFLAICKAMLETNILPDFISVDGAEGGTGAAPLEFSDYMGEMLEDGLVFVRNALVGCNLRDNIRIIASGKVATGFDILHKLALGADLCNSARAMMFALGCIQSLQCNRNTCPTGVTTQNPRLMHGLVVEDKYVRVANYHQATIDSMLEMAGAMGLKHLSNITPSYIYKRTSLDKTLPYSVVHHFLSPGDILRGNMPEALNSYWGLARADRF